MRYWKIVKNFVIVSVILAPLIGHAATFSELVLKLGKYIGQGLVPVLLAICALLLAVGVFRFIGAGNDPKRLIEGKNLILWGVIGLFAALSVWGLVRFVLAIFFEPGDLTQPDLDGLFNF